jgi:hypothetical protein
MFQTKTRWRFEMSAYVLVYAFLAIVMGAALYVVGTPWITPKPRKNGEKRSEEDIGNAHS